MIPKHTEIWNSVGLTETQYDALLKNYSFFVTRLQKINSKGRQVGGIRTNLQAYNPDGWVLAFLQPDVKLTRKP